MTVSSSLTVSAAGQGVWNARMAAALDADVTLCGFAGGPTGRAVRALLECEAFASRLVATQAESGCYVRDLRGDDRITAFALSAEPSATEVAELRHTLDDALVGADVLVVANPLPGEALPPSAFPHAVAAGHRAGAVVVVDLSSPRLDAALPAGPDVVKLNDWELAETVVGPVDTPVLRQAAVQALLDRGAGAVVVTSGPGPVLAVRPPQAPLELLPPRLEAGCAPGCGDALTGALAAGLARHEPWQQALTRAVAAGSAQFRHGPHAAPVEAVDELIGQVRAR
jgi:fructose-1-phosphate kinase PfkB-like protein